jgi:hypothetical protein
VYLIDWYWTWLEYRVDFSIANVKEPQEKLRICLAQLTEENKYDSNIPYVDEAALQKIVVSEFEKTYLTKNVDIDNKDGFFMPYKSLCKKISNIITEVNPRFTFSNTLVSTIMLSITHQLYYAEHLPSLTDIKYNPKNHRLKLYEFLERLVFKVISK